MKIRPVRAELFHADGRAKGDMTKLIVAFRNFANASENQDMKESTKLSNMEKSELLPSDLFKKKNRIRTL